MPDDKITAKWRAEIVAFDLQSAAKIEQEALRLMRQAVKLRELAEMVKAMPAEGVRRVYVAMQAERERARREKRGEDADAVVVPVAEESGRKN
ncbi:MAG: hypothetical protein AB7D37_11030 [Desulfovibrio sp.]